MARRYQDVMRDLVRALVAGDYPEGERLPSEAALAERFGASRGVMREALRALEERGLVVVRSGQGQLVRQREDWDVRSPEVLRAAIDRGPDAGVLAQAIAARAVVERAAAGMACRVATAADLDLLAARVAEMQAALHPGAVRTFDGSDPLVAAEVWFHRTLLLLSGNPVLAKLAEPLHAPLAEVRRVRAADRDGAAVKQHRRILEGVSSREPPLAAEAVTAYARQLTRWVRVPR
jgi:DNA-binding FadR family transcriptional regulator